MDSTPTPTPNIPTQPIKSSASKLPIKRKTPYPYPPPNPTISDPNYLPPVPTFVNPKDNSVPGGDSRHPPFKFHRIWTEPDEIRFLQGLLNCGSDNLSFPRDLHIFYGRFSNTMSQPYTKSQLSEKLRRLRKKFRVISTRISKGLDQSFLSPHDRALYELSMQLWHPDYAGTSPFGGGSENKDNKADLVGVEVSFLPEFISGPDPNVVENLESNCVNDDNVDDYLEFGDVGFNEEVKLSEVNVEFEEEQEMAWQGREEWGMGDVAAKAVIDVFDESLEQIRLGVMDEELSLNACEKKEGKKLDFERRWREQRVAELDVLTRRMRLVFEHSILQRQ